MIHTHTKIIAVIGVLFFLGCIALGGLFLWLVHEQKITYVEKKYSQIEMTERQKSQSTLVQTLDENKESRESLFTRVLKEAEVIDYLAYIESLSRDLGIELKTSSLTVDKINDTFESLVMNVEVKSSYEGALYFMELIEQLPYQVFLDKVQLTRESSTGSAVWRLTFEMRTTKFTKI